MLKPTCLFVCGALFAHAQGGPSLGFVYDANAQALRLIRGIPGAATFGDPMPRSAPLASAALSADHTVAVVNDGSWGAILSPAGAAARADLGLSLPASARVSVSPHGSAAAFYDAASGSLAVVTGIAARAVNTASIDMGFLPGAAANFAVDDGGGLLISGLANPGETLFYVSPGGAVRTVASLTRSGAMQFSGPKGNSAIVTDRGANQIWRIDNPDSGSQAVLVGSADDGVMGPVSAVLSQDGSMLWIANAGAHNVLGINTATRASVALDCSGFRLTGMHPLSDGLAFRLTGLDDGPMWILDTASPSVLFIPAIAAADPVVGGAQ